MRLRPWSVAERVLLALWLSVLAHGALLWLPLRPGGLNGGATAALTVRVLAAPSPARPAAALVAQPAAAAQPAGGVASAPQAAAPAADGGQLRLGADIYYPASELDRLAQERSSIVLPDVVWSGPPQPLTLLVFISETGQVDAVRFEGSPPKALASAIAPAFRAAWYQPGVKEGRAVKSYKRIRIEPQLETASAPALSH